MGEKKGKTAKGERGGKWAKFQAKAGVGLLLVYEKRRMGKGGKTKSPPLR